MTIDLLTVKTNRQRRVNTTDREKLAELKRALNQEKEEGVIANKDYKIEQNRRVSALRRAFQDNMGVDLQIVFDEGKLSTAEKNYYNSHSEELETVLWRFETLVNDDKFIEIVKNSAMKQMTIELEIGRCIPGVNILREWAPGRRRLQADGSYNIEYFWCNKLREWDSQC